MASKTKKEHRKKVEKFQQNIKSKIRKMEQNTMNLPQVREVPTWNPNQLMTVTGAELEVIYNYISSVSGAFSAAQGIMQRNIMNGNIKVEFDKLVTQPDGSFGYVRMPEEDAAKHREQFNKLLDELNQIQKEAVVAEPIAAVDTEEVPQEVEVGDANLAEAKVISLNP